jgi:hypothetical protein
MRRVRTATHSAVLGLLSIGLFNAFAPAAYASGKPPVLQTPPTLTATVGKPFSYTPSIKDPEGDKLNVRLYNVPAWITIDRATGRIYGTPPTVATHGWLAYKVYDGTGSTTGGWFTINVVKAAANVAPTIYGTPTTKVAVNTTYSFQPTARDANGDKLTFSISNRPAWATFDTSTGRLSGKPTSAGTFSKITIRVSDGRLAATLAPFTVTVTGTQNAAPVITGTPATSVSAGKTYSFTPKASDPNGDKLTFSIVNKPTWAAFNTTTGALTGTPTTAQAGTYANVTIRVSDGRVTTTLAPFSIAVVQASNGAATLSWTPPTQNTDGTSLTNLAGYRIYYGTSANALTQVIQVPNAGVATYMVENLAPATYYFALRAYNTQGAESASSNVVSKVVR